MNTCCIGICDLPLEIIQKIMMYYPGACHTLMVVLNIPFFYTPTSQKILKTCFTSKKVFIDRTEYQLPNGWLHSSNDQPAILWNDGGKEWYYNNKRHRDDDKPALTGKKGSQEWSLFGKTHRSDNKPAIVWFDGTQEWFINGFRSRTRDHEFLPTEVRSDGTLVWHNNNKLDSFNDHPSIIRLDGTREWYKDNKLHRSIGPAVVSISAEKYYFEGFLLHVVNKNYSKEDIEKLHKKA